MKFTNTTKTSATRRPETAPILQVSRSAYTKTLVHYPNMTTDGANVTLARQQPHQATNELLRSRQLLSWTGKGGDRRGCPSFIFSFSLKEVEVCRNIHPFISFHLSSVRSWQFSCLDVPAFQLLLGDPGAFSGSFQQQGDGSSTASSLRMSELLSKAEIAALYP